jgi:hypothetical protein
MYVCRRTDAYNSCLLTTSIYNDYRTSFDRVLDFEVQDLCLLAGLLVVISTSTGVVAMDTAIVA